MEVNFIEHETFLLYLAIFVLFCLSGMLVVAAAQINDTLRRIVKERDDLLQLLGRNIPEEIEIIDKNTLINEILQKRIEQLKETSVRINEELGKRTTAMIPARPKHRHRKIFIEKALDVD